MRDIKDEIMADAIENYIKAEREIIKLKKGIDWLIILCCVEASIILVGLYMKYVIGG